MSTTQTDGKSKDISKKEEALLKRRKEIERRLKFFKTQSADKKCFRNDMNNKETKTDDYTAANKFVNDGSFLNQFKKEVKPSSSNESIIISKELLTTVKQESINEDKKENNKHSLKDMPAKYFDNSDVKKPIYDETKEEATTIKQEDPLKSDWFQEALKRAKEKAKELVPQLNKEVSLSAGLTNESPENDSKKKKSRWGESSQPLTIVVPPISSLSSALSQGSSQQTNFNISGSVMNMVGEGQHMEAIKGVMITKLTRNNPAIIAYASKVFGNVDISDAQWKQCEEQMKMNIVFQLLKAKQQEAELLIQRGKVKYEYDSDEEVDGGTWEHKRRKMEMKETAIKAEELTREAEGKHHIGDFLPPEELSGFIEKYQALKDGRDPDLSDYKEKRLTEDNVGYKMLKSMGWTEGMGLGADGRGITNPINQKPKAENQGLGVAAPHSLSVNDDEYDAYRKRMMLAYRFRPNPLNNPRRSYY